MHDSITSSRQFGRGGSVASQHASAVSAVSTPSPRAARAVWVIIPVGPFPRSSTDSRTRRAAETPCAGAIRPPMRTLFPSACRPLVGASASAGSVTAAVCPGSGPGLPSLARSNQPVAERCGGLLGLAHERSQRYCQSAQPPADRSVQQLLRRRHWTAPAHGWAAKRRSGPPSAWQHVRTEAAPCLHRSAPQGHLVSTGAAALCPCYCFLSPLYPLTGALRTAAAPACRRLCRSYRFLWRLCRAPLGFLSTWASACYGERDRSACICPSAIFPPSLQGLALYCRRAPASRSGPPSLRAGGQACARACRTRRGRRLAASVVAACPHTPRRSLRSVVGRMVFY
jgi:hypothetical protein